MKHFATIDQKINVFSKTSSQLKMSYINKQSDKITKH